MQITFFEVITIVVSFNSHADKLMNYFTLFFLKTCEYHLIRVTTPTAKSYPDKVEQICTTQTMTTQRYDVMEKLQLLRPTWFFD